MSSQTFIDSSVLVEHLKGNPIAEKFLVELVDGAEVFINFHK